MIRIYFPILVVAQVLLAVVLWGFPGVWLLAGVPAAFVCAATVAHWRRPRTSGEPGREVRPGVIVLGALFTILLGVGGMTLMWGATAPETIVIERTETIDTPRERLWNFVGNPTQRTRWSTWISDIEPIGKGGTATVGSEWRATLMLERLAVPATLRVTAVEPFRELSWRVEPTGGSRLEDMHETITMAPMAGTGDTPGDDRHTVVYRLSYRVPTVLGRVGERIALRRPAERMADETLKALKAVSIGVQ